MHPLRGDIFQVDISTPSIRIDVEQETNNLGCCETEQQEVDRCTRQRLQKFALKVVCQFFIDCLEEPDTGPKSPTWPDLQTIASGLVAVSSSRSAHKLERRFAIGACEPITGSAPCGLWPDLDHPGRDPGLEAGPVHPLQGSTAPTGADEFTIGLAPVADPALTSLRDILRRWFTCGH